MKFCLICHIHLTSRQPTTTSSSISTTFCRKNTSTTRRKQKMPSKSSVNPKTGIFTLQECMCVQSLSCVCFLATPWTVAHQTSLSMGFSRQEYWSRLPLPPPGDLPDPGIEPASLRPVLGQVDSLSLRHLGNPKYGSKHFQTTFLVGKKCVDCYGSYFDQ